MKQMAAYWYVDEYGFLARSQDTNFFEKPISRLSSGATAMHEFTIMVDPYHLD
jgi:hypothetical protein